MPVWAKTARAGRGNFIRHTILAQPHARGIKRQVHHVPLAVFRRVKLKAGLAATALHPAHDGTFGGLKGLLGRRIGIDDMGNQRIELRPPFRGEDGGEAADEKLQVVYQRWLELLEQQQLYQLEFGITLAQAARKLQVPARQLSQAVNQCYGASFSVLLNDKRISKAKQLLLQNPPLAVTDVMYQAGFATKSNFHKEFVRVTGKTPGAYRASAAMPPD